MTYGINFSSPLNDLNNFHVVDQLPQDIMHILLEGIVPYELVLMLISFITDHKYFSLQLLNDRIACFAYSANETKDKPSPVRSQALVSRGTSLSQSGEFFVFVIHVCIIMYIMYM